MIETWGLTKDFGEGRGIFDLDLLVRRGEIFGFLGPNGAGKSTTIRLLLDLIRPTRGTARVLGMDPLEDGVALRRHIGHLPGEFTFNGALTGRTVLADLARLRGDVDPDRLDALTMRLQADLDEPVRRLSKGNKQKLGLVQAFMHDPSLLILDEPTDGLDPLLRREVHGLLHEAKQAGHTVFLSSHVIHEVEQVCDRVAILRQGRLRVVSTLQELRGHNQRRLEVEFAIDVDPQRFVKVPGLAKVEHRGGRVVRFTMRPEASMDLLLKLVANYPVRSLHSGDRDLEAVFLTLYGDDGAHGPLPRRARRVQGGPMAGSEAHPDPPGHEPRRPSWDEGRRG